ncbi:ATP-binding protein [Muricauda sp. 334s03]|uniref:ATP-binding protein n=2 Tax=Flagellimonas TaxID=444459 RepID=A0A418NBY0_9FLAO|nr:MULTISPECIES: ATP-binding protein [Allomuricauda]MDF0714566.1 ATP-binding protein [[Muricauda] yonaguniensis]RIV73261.1 ATP-binding protein [Allomuricauda aequoris]TXK07073.1 ATP-binding protein [Allomuricauda aequoris]
METITINVYYQKIIGLILELYDTDFETAGPGHCMKITGLGVLELEYLWDLLFEKHSHLDMYIVSEAENTSRKFISATKLIELRNKQDKPLLILIPSNSRTAAEDSYGNATFKEISLEGMEEELVNTLIEQVPDDVYDMVVNDIINYLNPSNTEVIDYLIAIDQEGYEASAIGNCICNLCLIPDEVLTKHVEKIRSRLNFNRESVELLSAFNKPLYDRIAELRLENDSIQKDIVNFLKTEKGARNAQEICNAIKNGYDELNFSYWPIPDLDFTHIKLITEEIKSKDLKVEDGTNVLYAQEGNVAKLKVRFHTNPNPKDIKDLRFFRIILMAVNGSNGEEITVLRKIKNSNSNRPYRDATLELNPNIIEEGSYFIKVLAEDEHGNMLNTNDEFRESKIQKAWEEAKKEDESISKSAFPYKLSCDSIDFDYVIEESLERDEDQRKDKLNNVLQAYFKYRIEALKNDIEIELPKPSETSNIWINDGKEKHNSTFHINYSDQHNYQINISTKLRQIENKLLANADSLGYVRCQLKGNKLAVGFEQLQFVKSELNEIVPKSLLKSRLQLFEAITNSNTTANGIFETADIFNLKESIRKYVDTYTKWTTKLNNQLATDEIALDEKTKLREFLIELQMIDLVKVKSKLPDGSKVEAILLSPLHPLRLCWTLQLLEVFENWEQRTKEFSGHKESWSQHLEELFIGQLSPENNQQVLIETTSQKQFNYSGELSFGWGLYLSTVSQESKNGMTSISRQLQHYLRLLFNITKDNYVETDLSIKLVIRHIKNYLAQHPYIDKLVVNLFNAGDAEVFANAFVELEKEKAFESINYEVRIFKGDDKIIEHGEALKTLINPESNISEEAEAFSQPSKNRLFPKLRFSINDISDFLKDPSSYTSHLSFLVSPFPITIELIKPTIEDRNFYLNGLITESTVKVDENGSQIKWNRFIESNKLPVKYDTAGANGIKLFENLQSFVSGALVSKHTLSIPSTQLRLNDKDKVLLTHLHDYSDWVITFDKNLGPQIFDQPSKDGKIPFLLDYVPGEEALGISSYLTTRPTSEVLGLLGPHFEEFNLDIHNEEDEHKIKILLEDLRAVSSSLVLQLNSSKNKAFEVIGSAFTKRVLEKKEMLEDAFLIPIDLHQNLFENLPSGSKSRADNLLVSINPDKKEILISVIEIKCRKALGQNEKDALRLKMLDQIENTIEALRNHFDPSYNNSFDRLDREIKNKELKSLLTFYLERAHRYEYLSNKAYNQYLAFLQKLDSGFSLHFRKLGLIFDFAASERHKKVVVDNESTFFTFGGKLIDDILDPNSDLNTKRLEESDFDKDLTKAFGNISELKPFIQRFKSNLESNENTSDSSGDDKVENSTEADSQPDNPTVRPPTEQKEYPKDQEGTLRAAETEIELNTDIDSVEFMSNHNEHICPEFDILIGKTSPSNQFGILGESILQKKIAIDLSETNTISLFGVQGGGKSYTIGTISEMVLKQFSNINLLPAPLAGVIFHYSESMDYAPEFTSMIYSNDQNKELEKLKLRYGAEPNNIEDVIILTPKDKIEERQAEYPSIKVLPIAFNSKELNVQDWLFILGAIGNDSTYIRQLKAIMKQHRSNITINALSESVEDSELLSNSQKALARQKLSFAREYIDDSFMMRDVLMPGRLVVVDLRDEFIVKDEALGLFVIMLNIFSAVKNINGLHFNKFIVFDEAHKYMDNKDLTGNIVTAIREMRHKGVSIMIASQDPPSLPNEIIELSSVVLLHKFNSPQWLKHIQKSITQLSTLTPADMSALTPGEGFLWATKATEKSISIKPVKVSTRPRVTKHGGGTIQATGN